MARGLRMPAGNQHRPVRRANRTGGDAVRKRYPSTGQAVEIGRLDLVFSVERERRGSKLIGKHK